MAKGTLILLRHGQTTYNEQMRMCGQFDAPLTPLGEEQAVEAGKRLVGVAFDKVYASSLSRAFNTAALALASAAIVLDIEARPELMECHAGDFTGLRMDDPKIVNFPRGNKMEIPGGETEPQFVGRVKKFYEEELLPRLEKGETVLVVSHAGVMHALDAVMNPDPANDKSVWDTRRRLNNTAIIVVDYEDGKIAGERALDDKAKVVVNNGSFTPK